MKKTSPVTWPALIAFAAVFFFGGCKKEGSDTLSAQEEQQAAAASSESEAESDGTFDDVSNNVMGVNTDVGIGGVGIFGRTAPLPVTGREMNVDSTPSCVTVTITPLPVGAFPKTVVLDFGTGCYSHGHLRSGRLKTVFTGPLREAGSVATTTFDDFTMDSVKVGGTHRITNTTAATAGAIQRQFKIEVTAGKLTKPNGNYAEWNSVRVNTQTEGNGTAGPLDDVFKVTGNASGKVKRENLIVLWNAEITEALNKKFTCAWVSKGRLKAVRQGLPANTPWVAVLDYGSGTCDTQAALTVNGNTRQITLH